MATTATQTRYPWRAVLRTIVQAVLALAAAAPLIAMAVTDNSEEALTGAGAVFLAVCAGITRVVNLPVVDQFIRRFLPWLAPDPARGTVHPENTSVEDGEPDAPLF